MDRRLTLGIVDLTIRPARPGDREAVYDICARTGDAGDDATGLVEHPELYGHLWAGAYLELEPRFAFVAEEDGAVHGYVLGALDTSSFEQRLDEVWWPPLRDRYPLPGGGTEVDRRHVAMLHHPVPTPLDVVARYPSHLHIDLLPRLQGRGVGRALMHGLLAALRDAGSTGVHLGVSPRNERALGFYDHLGFRRHHGEHVVLCTMPL